MTRRPRKFFGAWDGHEAELASRNPARRVVTQIRDGGLLIGSVDRVGIAFECFTGTGRYIGRFGSCDLAIEAVRSAHRSGRIVAGLGG